jgi:hypothetical protein
VDHQDLVTHNGIGYALGVSSGNLPQQGLSTTASEHKSTRIKERHNVEREYFSPKQEWPACRAGRMQQARRYDLPEPSTAACSLGIARFGVSDSDF